MLKNFKYNDLKIKQHLQVTCLCNDGWNIDWELMNVNMENKLRSVITFLYRKNKWLTCQQINGVTFRLFIKACSYYPDEVFMHVSHCRIKCRRGVVVLTTSRFRSTKLEPSFCAGSNPARGVSEICNVEDLWQWSWLEKWLNAFISQPTNKKYEKILTFVLTFISPVFAICWLILLNFSVELHYMNL